MIGSLFHLPPFLFTLLVGMTKRAIMSQTRIQRAQNKNSEYVTKKRGDEQTATSCVFQLVLYGKSCEGNRKLAPIFEPFMDDYI